MSRRHISLKVKLAAALLQMKRADESGVLQSIVAHEDAKRMSADQIISLFHFDHYPIFKADGGPDEPWNLDPKPILEHRKKTAKFDVPQIAKTRRIRRHAAQHRQAMADKLGLAAPTVAAFETTKRSRQKSARTIPSRPFQKSKRRLRSRGASK